MERAYSVFNIKAVNEEERTLSGIATTPTTDRMGDIVDPMGAEFSLPMPFLWQHDSHQPIGHVIAADKTADGIPVQIKLVKTDEPGKLKDRLDEAWQSIKLRLVAGLSIGFKSIEHSFLDDGGIHFTRWAWHELSAVTIPANAEAQISLIKSLDNDILKSIKPPAATGKGRIVRFNTPSRVREPYVLKTIVR